MPTIARIGPYRLYFFSHEPNEPPHIHIDREAASLKAWLLNVGLARSRGFRPQEIGRILQLVEDNRESLLEAWYDFFGTDH